MRGKDIGSRRCWILHDRSVVHVLGTSQNYWVLTVNKLKIWMHYEFFGKSAVTKTTVDVALHYWLTRFRILETDRPRFRAPSSCLVHGGLSTTRIDNGAVCEYIQAAPRFLSKWSAWPSSEDKIFKAETRCCRGEDGGFVVRRGGGVRGGAAGETQVGWRDSSVSHRWCHH